MLFLMAPFLGAVFSVSFDDFGVMAGKVSSGRGVGGKVNLPRGSDTPDPKGRRILLIWPLGLLSLLAS